MDNDTAGGDAGRRAKVHTVLATITIVLGAVLLFFMITVEDEPGAIPLALLVGGGIWLFVTRSRIRSQHK